jgi:hypothetical protein
MLIIDVRTAPRRGPRLEPIGFAELRAWAPEFMTCAGEERLQTFTGPSFRAGPDGPPKIELAALDVHDNRQLIERTMVCVGREQYRR